jgi:hypothetical protein
MSFTQTVVTTRKSPTTPWFGEFIPTKGSVSLKALKQKLTASGAAVGATTKNTLSADKLTNISVVVYPSKQAYDNFQATNAADLATITKLQVDYEKASGITRLVTAN